MYCYNLIQVILPLLVSSSNYSAKLSTYLHLTSCILTQESHVQLFTPREYQILERQRLLPTGLLFTLFSTLLSLSKATHSQALSAGGAPPSPAPAIDSSNPAWSTVKALVNDPYIQMGCLSNYFPSKSPLGSQSNYLNLKAALDRHCHPYVRQMFFLMLCDYPPGVSPPSPSSSPDKAW